MPRARRPQRTATKSPRVPTARPPRPRARRRSKGSSRRSRLPGPDRPVPRRSVPPGPDGPGGSLFGRGHSRGRTARGRACCRARPGRARDPGRAAAGSCPRPGSCRGRFVPATRVVPRPVRARDPGRAAAGSCPRLGSCRPAVPGHFGLPVLSDVHHTGVGPRHPDNCTHIGTFVSCWGPVDGMPCVIRGAQGGSGQRRGDERSPDAHLSGRERRPAARKERSTIGEHRRSVQEASRRTSRHAVARVVWRSDRPGGRGVETRFAPASPARARCRRPSAPFDRGLPAWPGDPARPT